MFLRIVCLFMMLGLVFVLPNGGQAEVPDLLSYQGRLLDDSGQPANDTLDMTIQLYDDAAGGGSFWKEDHADVLVDDGLFSVILGQTNSLGSGFDGSTKWLTVTIKGVESTPRIPIVMVPYSYRSRYADTAAFAHSSVSGDYVEIDGDTMTGDLMFDADLDGSPDAFLRSGSQSADLTLYDESVITTKLWGDLYGELDLYRASNSGLRVLMYAGGGGGRLQLTDSLEISQIILDGKRGAHDLAVQLPDSAINASEMLNEPGIVRAYGTGEVELESDTQFVDLASITIDIPAPGYIHLTGHCSVDLEARVGGNSVVVQIGEVSNNPGGGYLVGAAEIKLLATGSSWEQTFPLSTEIVYYKETAGSYTFYLQGRYAWGWDDGERAALSNGIVVATYFPTAYGPVKTAVTDPTGYPEATPFLVPGQDGAPSRTMYDVDLRQLELRVERERREAAEAEKALLEARLKQGQRPTD